MLKARQTYEIMTPESVGWTGTSMILGKHSGRHAFARRLAELGYPLCGEPLETAFSAFKALAGTMTTRTGATLFFAMFVNNVPVPRETGAAREGRVLGRLCEILHDNGP